MCCSDLITSVVTWCVTLLMRLHSHLSSVVYYLKDENIDLCCSCSCNLNRCNDNIGKALSQNIPTKIIIFNQFQTENIYFVQHYHHDLYIQYPNTGADVTHQVHIHVSTVVLSGDIFVKDKSLFNRRSNHRVGN